MFGSKVEQETRWIRDESHVTVLERTEILSVFITTQTKETDERTVDRVERNDRVFKGNGPLELTEQEHVFFRKVLCRPLEFVLESLAHIERVAVSARPRKRSNTRGDEGHVELEVSLLESRRTTLRV